MVTHLCMVLGKYNINVARLLNISHDIEQEMISADLT